MRAPELGPRTTIPGLLLRHAALRPETVALHVLAGRPRTLTYAALRDRVAAVAADFRRHGVGKGDRVVLMTNHDERLVFGLLAAASVGAVGCPAGGSRSLAMKVASDFLRINPARAVWSTGHYANEARRLVGSGDVGIAMDAEAATIAGEDDLAWWHQRVEERSPDSPFYVNHTSGSMGVPKFTEPSDRLLLINAEACAQHFAVDGSARHLCTFAYHQHEHFLRPLLVGGRSILVPIADVVMFDLALTAAEAGATHLLTTPGVAERLSRSPNAEALQGTLRVIEIGGGIVPDEVLDQLRRRSGARVCVAYGSTETSGAALVSEGREGGLVPLPTYAVQVRDRDGRDAAPGEPGELIIEGPALCAGYLALPPGAVRLTEGRFHTRDMVVRVHGGGLQVLGRMDNTVKLAFGRVQLEAMEEILRLASRGRAEAVQCLDIEPCDALSGLSGATLVGLVLLNHGAPPPDLSEFGQAIRREGSRRHAVPYLDLPSHVLFVEPTEMEVEGGKVLRAHARRLFPYKLEEWHPSRRFRLARLSLPLVRNARIFQRLLGEATTRIRATTLMAGVGRAILRRMLSWAKSLGVPGRGMGSRL